MTRHPAWHSLSKSCIFGVALLFAKQPPSRLLHGLQLELACSPALPGFPLHIYVRRWACPPDFCLCPSSKLLQSQLGRPKSHHRCVLCSSPAPQGLFPYGDCKSVTPKQSR